MYMYISVGGLGENGKLSVGGLGVYIYIYIYIYIFVYIYI